MLSNEKKRDREASFFCLWVASTSSVGIPLRGLYLPSLCLHYSNRKTAENQPNTQKLHVKHTKH